MNVLQLFKPITTFVFDVDGVLTDGMLLVLPGGVQARRMNIKDGYAIQLAVKKGYKVVVISGGHSEEVHDRLTRLGVKDIFMRVEDKLQCLKDYMSANNLNTEEILFMGDDIPDYEVMQYVSLACCPGDAIADIKTISKYISLYKGGEGCARDVMEKTLKLRGDWSIDTHIKAQ